MKDELFYALHHPLTYAVIASVVTAIDADIQAFKAFQTFEDAAKYRWSVFAFRVCRGAVLGLLGYFGVSIAAQVAF